MYEVGTVCNSGNRDVSGAIKLVINGHEIEMVPFVQNVLRDTILAITKELNGYETQAKIEITIG